MLKNLKDECYIVMGQSPSSEYYNQCNNGIPFLQGRKTFGDKYPKIDTWTTKPLKIGIKNSVLMSVRAPVGDVNIAPFDICIGRGLASIKMKNNNNQYLYYLLKNNIENIKRKSSGTVFEAISRSDLENLVLNFNSEEEQLKIEKILDNIDKKIELNNKLNNNLQEQLQIYFEEKINKYKNKELPDGWKIMKLEDISIFSQGVQVPIEQQVEKIDEEHKVRFIRIVDITQRNDKDIRYIEDKQRGYVEEKDIFMIRYGTPGILSRNYNGIIANNLFKIIPRDFVTSEYLFSALNSSEIQCYIKQNATSSTMPAISFRTLNDQEIIVADQITVDVFSKYSDLIRRKQLNLIKENEILGELRDTLLPKLMNGEIDLDNIEI